MNMLVYKQSLLNMTIEQIEEEYAAKRKFKNTEELEMLHVVEIEYSKLKYRQEQEIKRKKEQERIGSLALEYENILDKWKKQGVKVTNGYCVYKEKTMYISASHKSMDEIIFELREEDEKFQIVKLEELK